MGLMAEFGPNPCNWSYFFVFRLWLVANFVKNPGVMHRIVSKSDPITLVGGGEMSKTALALATARGPLIVAADGGADATMTLGLPPDYVVGDMDSVSQRVKRTMPSERLIHIAEQDTTDFDKALRLIDAPLVLAVGFLGKRLDHQLAALHVLVQNHPSPCILIGEHEVVYHVMRPLSLDMIAGETVSLFPLGQVTGRSSGLEWPIEGINFSPMTFIGTSNRATGPVEMAFDGPGMLAMLPLKYLDDIIAQLMDQSQATAR